jgi:hypothetical protein
MKKREKKTLIKQLTKKGIEGKKIGQIIKKNFPINVFSKEPTTHL